MLITRPEADSLQLKTEVEALGYSVMIEPLLAIEPVDQTEPIPGDVQIIALTSAHAVPALNDEAKGLPIYVVGEATAVAARAAGCRQIHSAEGDVRSLAQLIVKNCRSRDGSILHLSGEVIREGLAETLTRHDFRYKRRVVYRAAATTCLSDRVIDAWRRRAIAAVLLFSPRSAEVLVKHLNHHGLESYVDSTAAICLSEQTATPCKGLVWKTIRSAARPNRQALLRALVGSTAIC